MTSWSCPWFVHILQIECFFLTNTGRTIRGQLFEGAFDLGPFFNTTYEYNSFCVVTDDPMPVV